MSASKVLPGVIGIDSLLHYGHTKIGQVKDILVEDVKLVLLVQEMDTYGNTIN